MNNKLNIIFIILFVIVITIIIGFGIVNLIDRKISNVAVNIPPYPKIIVNVKKNKDGEIKLCDDDSKTIDR